MDDRVLNRLIETSESLSLYSAVPPSRMEEVFNFDAREMEVVESKVLSMYHVMLSQYLITLQSRFNTARVKAGQKKKALGKKTKDLISIGAVSGSTLKERERNAISSSTELQELELGYDIDAAERDLLEGLDKPIIELINSFKAEIRRRDTERQYTDKERRS